MNKEERLQKIKDILLKEGQVDVQTIISKLEISEPTARRDILCILEKESIYCKIRNGISLIKGHEAELLFEEKLRLQTNKKKAIARRAAQLIQDNQTLMIDSGTTCFFFAQEILGRPLQVVTSDLRIAYELSKDRNIHLHVLGGEVRSGYYSLGGILACQNASAFHVDTLIISADAFSVEKGITNMETFEVPIKQALKTSCENMIVLLDSSKINQKSFYQVMATTDISTIITDDDISPSQSKEIQQRGINLIIASP